MESVPGFLIPVLTFIRRKLLLQRLGRSLNMCLLMSRSQAGLQLALSPRRSEHGCSFPISILFHCCRHGPPKGAVQSLPVGKVCCLYLYCYAYCCLLRCGNLQSCHQSPWIGGSDAKSQELLNLNDRRQVLLLLAPHLSLLPIALLWSRNF